MRPFAYKILSPPAWAAAQGAGVLAATGDDARDGFIHLSAAHQIAGTLARHFSGATDLVLVAFDAAALGPALRWEASRDGALFPHYYGALPVSAATGEWRLARGGAGRFNLPDALR